MQVPEGGTQGSVKDQFSLYGHNVTSLCSYVTIAPRRHYVNIIIFVL
jgi:hypothetical protein